VQERRSAKGAFTSAGSSHANGKYTVHDLCDAYLTLHARQKRSGDSYARFIKNFIKPVWGSLRADEIRRPRVSMLHVQVSEETPETLGNESPDRSFLPHRFDDGEHAVGLLTVARKSELLEAGGKTTIRHGKNS
jgi:hypothetical protein